MYDEYVKQQLNRLKGVSGTSDLFGTLKDIRKGMINVLEPGDLALMAADGEIIRSQSSPIAYDLWYLKHFVNMLYRHTERYEVIPEEYIADQLSFLSEKLYGMRPMQIIRNLEDLVRNENDYWVATGIEPRWAVNNESFLNLLAYEMWAYNLPAQFPSPGVTKYEWTPYYENGLKKYRISPVNDPSLFVREDYVGYVTFPAGQLGVMEVLSILKQTETEIDGFEMDYEEHPLLDSVCEFLFPPIDDNTGKNKCFGDQFIQSGYIVPEDKSKNVEWLETWPIPYEYYEDCAPQQWIRYWIHKDEKWPVPGEFIGIVVKSLALPPHVWWFQDSCPFVYSGNYIETDHLTSGIVVEKTLEADRTDGGFGTQYKIKIHGYDIFVYASDFMEYNVNDRVGIMKVFSPYEKPNRQFWVYEKETARFMPDPDRKAIEIDEPFKTAVDENLRLFTDKPMVQGFSFKDMYAFEEMDEDGESFDYLILPIEFYKET